ncbi:thioredoxin family protein [Pyrodictium abyssi]|uniref:Thioredoxin n=1 Tax=Pyrodictium abyssi TaxID=54256 RepID=A0ABN6ZQ01_9CREN|nr:thioredoxin [Pyrodictium abyssi]
MKGIEEIAERIKKLVDRKIEQIEQELGDPLYYAGKDFDELIEKYPVAVVEFAAPWCNPCKAYTPVFRRVARRLMKEYSGRVVFMYLDTDQLPEIADRYNIENIPTTIIFVNGHVADVIMGATQESRLEEKVRSILEEVAK